MKNLVKDLINTVNNHKVFSAVLCITAVVAEVLYGSGASVVVFFCLTGIKGFAHAWKKVEKEEYLVIFRTFFLAAMIFLHGPLVYMVAELVPNSFWHETLMTIDQWIAWTAFGFFGVMFVELLVVGGYNGWKKLVRWAN